jgi:cell wall-associated NlpC family hydrolase
MSALDQRIIDKCTASWEEEFFAGTKNKDNCSGFVKSVAQKLNVPLPQFGNADGIMDEISRNWTSVSSGKDAAAKASLGMLVIAGLKAADHTPARNNGHVVIVVSGTLYKNTYPRCWCGSIGSAQSKGDKTIGEVWNQTDRDNVEYYAYPKGVFSGG